MTSPSSPAIAFYVTGHGFGHAARSKPILDRLAASGARLYLRSGADPKFFASVPGLDLHREHYDVGSVQADGLNVDPLESLRQYAAIHAQREAIIAREAAFVRQAGVQLVVSDVTPLAFDIATAAGVPAIASSHFTWDWIYEPYVALHPEYAWLLDAIRASYAQATLALEMPFAHDFGVFPRVAQIPLVVRTRTFSRAEIRAAFDVPEGKRLAVLSMGGMDWGTSPLDTLRAHREWVFVLPPDVADLVRGEPNLRAVPPAYPHFHDLTAAADLLIAKAGGVTVSECIAFHTPLICSFRNDFREDELLRPALAEYAHARVYAKAAFEAGAWLDERLRGLRPGPRRGLEADPHRRRAGRRRDHPGHAGGLSGADNKKAPAEARAWMLFTRW